MNLSSLLSLARPPGEAGAEPHETHERPVRPFVLYPPRGRKGLDPTRPAEFGSRIEQFRRKHASLPNPRLYGAVHILDLEQIHLRFGRRWPELREKAFQIIEHILDRRLGADDLYVVASERTIYVLVSGRRRLEAETHLRLIAGEITGRLCGLVPGGVAVRIRTLPFDLVSGLAGVQGLSQLRERVAECERETENRELEAFGAAAERLELVFEPLVHPRKRLVPAHRLDAVFTAEDGELRPAEDLCEERFAGIFDASVDLWLVERAGETLAARTGRAGTFVAPLRAETLLAQRPRQQYLSGCRKLPGSSNRHLIFEILDLPASTPQARVRELVGYVKPFGLAVAVRIYRGALTIEHLEGTGVRFLTFADAPSAGGAPMPAVALREIAALGREGCLHTACLGIASEARLREALDAGVDYVAGPAVVPPQTAPLSRRRL